MLQSTSVHLEGEISSRVKGHDNDLITLTIEPAIGYGGVVFFTHDVAQLKQIADSISAYLKGVSA